MAGDPIMTMLQEGCPPGRLMRLGWDTPDGSGGGYYIIPDDGREYMDIPMGEMRPYPAFDAMQELSRISGLPLSQMLAVEKEHDDAKEASGERTG